MPIRKLTLEEWFLIYQLDHVRRCHFHLPLEIDVDVTRLHSMHQSQGKAVPWTAVVTKAAGVLLQRHPGANRVVFRTVFGDRILEPDYIAVNLPIGLRENGRVHLNATVVRDAHLKSVDEIHSDLRQSKNRRIGETKMGPIVHLKKNNFINRMRLRLVHFAATNFPVLYEKFGAGGISVSSLMNTDDGVSGLRIQAYGQTGFTIGLASVTNIGERTIMRLGIAYDHYAFSGEEASIYARSLSEILRNASEVASIRPLEANRTQSL